MTCTEPTRPHAASELCDDLEATPSVLAVDALRPRESPANCETLEVVVEATARGTVPLAVIHRATRAGLSPAAVDPHNHPDYLRVLLR